MRLLYIKTLEEFPISVQPVLARGLKDPLQDRICRPFPLPEDCLPMHEVFDKWTSQ
ncbi:MAG: hypothetical protein JJU11_09150 [Candidatus Sumerlaeia bacterium]|nr:hypothetical protein [Candidatus Sumerlaeia bacterium]